MLRQVSRSGAPAGRVISIHRRMLSVPPPSNTIHKTTIPSTGVKLPSHASSTVKTPSSMSVKDSSTGSSLYKLLALGFLSAPGATMLYLKQNPEWNPTILKENEQWIRFRELVLGQETIGRKDGMRMRMRMEEKKRLPEELSAFIVKGHEDMEKEEEEEKEKEEKIEKEEDKTDKKETKEKKKDKKKKKEEKEETMEKKEKKEKEEGKTEKKLEKAEKKAEKVAKKAEKAEKKAAKLKEEVEAKKSVGAKVKDTVHNVEEKVKDTVHHVEEKVKKEVKTGAAAMAAATTAVEREVDAATDKAREKIAALASEASPDHLIHQMDKQIQATTNDLLSSLKAESDAAAAEMDKQYLSGVNELDANALAIRVAQLATEMKHRSKWEAVRMLESFRHMEEDARKKSAEVLRRQDELHKELLARELRLQQELLSRQLREEMAALKKQYADDLARNVNQQRARLLSELQRTFARESKAIEERYTQQLEDAKSEMHKTLVGEREKRVQQLESYRAELRAIGTVLDNSSTYEAFSHRVHKASMAALALSDRIEAAAPLRSEIRALREAARNDSFIEAAVKSLPQDVIEQGAPSVSQLQDRFKVVKTVGHRAALVPEKSGIIGQAFGTALSLLMIPPGGPIEGTDTDAILSRAEFAVKAGDIEKAVMEMKGLSGLPAQVSQDWISAAESRLAVEQTAKVIKAHVALLAASCA